MTSHLPCPSCSSSDAYSVYDDGHGFCFSCETYVSPEDKEKEDYQYEYLPWRGISSQTMKFYDALTKIDRHGKPVSIGFKYPNGAHKVRLLDHKQFYSVGEINKAGLFGRDKFSAGSYKYVTITEGELDALSLHQVVGGPVCSVQSSSSAVRDVTADLAWLASFERVYLAFDADEKGREAARQVAKLFDYTRLYVVHFTRHKDANDYVRNGEEQELKNIWWNSKQYLPETVISSFHDFEAILKEQSKPGVPYPFPTLTDMTFGIRQGESVLITAPEGVGKTELMHTLEHHLLKETANDVGIGSIFLEEPKYRHLQAVAGLQLRKAVHLPTSGVSNDEIMVAVKEAVRQDDRLHLYSHFGSSDPEILLDTIRFLVSARKCGYVLLDHISMVVSGLSGEDERRALDYLSTRLEMMVKELSFALIMVSHVNDNGFTRGSRLISKIADMRIDLDRDYMSLDPLVRNTTNIKLSKNRFCGRTGPAGILVFDPVTGCYTEVDHGRANNSTPTPSNGNLRVEERTDVAA